MLDVVSTLSGITVPLNDLLKIASVFFLCGGLWFEVRSNKGRINKLEDLHEKLPATIQAALTAPMDRMEQTYKERIERVEASHSVLQDRFLKAMENLAREIGSLTVELRSMAASHEERFKNLEKGTE